MIALPVRTEFGFERTFCDCDDCSIFCRFMPGMLVPADLPRLYAAQRSPGETTHDWALRCLLASPGALVSIQGRMQRIPTLVLRRA